MSARELLYRVGQQVTFVSLFLQYKFKIGLARRQVRPDEFSFCTGPQRRLPTVSVDVARLRQASGSLIQGETRVANGNWQWHDIAGIWHRAPDTGRLWPVSYFGSIDYRSGNDIGDVRQLWEPSRLQHLLHLALIVQNGMRDEQEKAIRMLNAQLRSWTKENPPLAGPHYVSAMECALRLIAVCHALDIVRERIKGNEPWSALAQIAHSHTQLIERRLSLYSSTGNHTVAEAAGLVYAGVLFPELKRSEERLRKGIEILSAAAESQVLRDGGGVEQAFWYHAFNIQLLSLVVSLLKFHDIELPKQIPDAVERGSRFLSAVADDQGQWPTIGDADGGYALSRYLQIPAYSSDAAPNAHTFHDSGYTIASVCSGDDSRFILDHGPLGLSPAYGHGHADALSLTLRAFGEDVFIDPGTYTYSGDEDWRAYFRGTRAHNTVTVDGRDQAKQDGCFLWSQPFASRLLAADIDSASGGRLIAEHDGYGRSGVRHLRGLAWITDQWLLVLDRLTGTGRHTLQLHWHSAISPIQRDDLNVDLPVAGSTISAQFQGGVLSLHRGERQPVSGWRSPSYGSVEPITTMQLYFSGRLPHVFTTLIRLPGSRQPGKELEESLQWIENQVL